MGPLYLTPSLNIGTVGIDSNVFYTPGERQTDFLAQGGPGLEARLPLGQSVVLGARGGLGYSYFARTASQRRYTKSLVGFLELATARTQARLSAQHSETFQRPDFEVDERVFQSARTAELSLRRDAGRVSLLGRGSVQTTEAERGTEFFGADLAANLGRDTYRASGGLRIPLTAKTSFVVEAEREWERFLEKSARDFDSNRFQGGLALESATRLAGRAVAGVQALRARLGTVTAWHPSAEVDLTYHFSPRTRLTAGYRFGRTISAFDVSGSTPTARTVAYELGLEKALWGSFDLRLFGSLREFTSDGAVVIVDADGTETSGVRDDRQWSGGANLGVRLWNAVRVGLEARYSDRTSTFEDFGVDGLIVGFTIDYSPGELLGFE